MRGLFKATIRLEPESAPALIEAMRAAEIEIAEALRRPTQEQQQKKLRFAVMPLVVAVVSALGKADQDRP